jgi:uncharacterized membrane protein YozB (DUF420 family)
MYRSATAFATLLIVAFSMATAVSASAEPAVGVKQGDWIEYNVNVTGSPPPIHDINWFRIDITDVETTAFQANVTNRFVNGSDSSALWNFNFSDGEVEGWVVIPANLNAGETFFDASKPANITIQGQEQKTVAGAIRTITYANDSQRTKEWDKATGVYTQSTEVLKNFTVVSEATATNMWASENNSETLGLSPTLLYALVVGVVLAASAASLTLVVVKRRRQKLALPRLSQGKVAMVVIIVVLVVMGAVALTPISQSQVSLNFHDINLIMQTFWTALVLVSMWFRARGNYYAHAILMIVVVTATLVSFSGVLVMSPPTGGSMDSYVSSPLNLAELISHAILSLPAIILGVWLVVLWRPHSTTFPAKTKKMAQATAILWVLSYVAGVLGYLVSYTPLFQ